MDLYQQYIHKSRYARYIDNLQRREHWDETVNRYLDFIQEHAEELNTGGSTKIVDQDLRNTIFNAIHNLEVMPSMRAMMTAGPALKRDNTAGYNCSYLPVDDPKAFDEAMFILLCGTGVGFSVERQFIAKLPEVPERLYESDTVIDIKDSREGWAKGFRTLIAILYSGEIPKWNTSKVRPKGARLKTFGGRASGSEPLEELFKFTVKTFRSAQGRKLSSLECHDIMCKVGDIVVVGGVRRSAMISLSNLSDDRMRHAKSGAWWEANVQRALANNSVCYTEKPDIGMFLKEWLSLYESKSGERGIFNREASKKQAKKNGRRNGDHEFGTNPCSEIILRPYQFCNLTEVVIRSTDTMKSILDKIEIATILGTLQSSLTHFPYLRKVWQKNTEEERLLGVSLTGIMDNKLFNDAKDQDLSKRLEELRTKAIEVNAEWADILGIPQSASITCVKPSGTVSQLVDSASGIHARHAKYYFRRVRGDNRDPLTQHLKDAGVPNEPDVTKPESITVFTFPMKAPEGAIVRDDMNAVDHLDLWLIYQRHYCEHKPSVTINVKEEEWVEVASWVWKYFDEISGVSFLPSDGGTYKQAPYEEITKDQYEVALKAMPKSIDWNLIEVDDHVESVKSLACTANGCELP
jgi:ribonucleoside-diphosphate reductase alpha chain